MIEPDHAYSATFFAKCGARFLCPRIPATFAFVAGVENIIRQFLWHYRCFFVTFPAFVIRILARSLRYSRVGTASRNRPSISCKMKKSRANFRAIFFSEFMDFSLLKKSPHQTLQHWAVNILEFEMKICLFFSAVLWPSDLLQNNILPGIPNSVVNSLWISAEESVILTFESVFINPHPVVQPNTSF